MYVLNMEIFYVNNYCNCNSGNALSVLCSGNEENPSSKLAKSHLKTALRTSASNVDNKIFQTGSKRHQKD